MVLYPWPADVHNTALNEALEIGMVYLERTGQDSQYLDAQKRAARAIIAAWRRGVNHKLRLANYAILAVETGRGAYEGELPSFYPRLC